MYAVAYLGSHHVTLFAILGYAMSQGVTNLYLIMLPTVSISAIISCAFIIYYVFENDRPLSRYALVLGMKAKHLVTLCFVYAFGYFAPTLQVISIVGAKPTFLAQMVINNLAYDLIFTVLLSWLMLGRKSLSAMSGHIYLPLVLCIVMIAFAESFDTERTGDGDDKIPLTTTVKMKFD